MDAADAERLVAAAAAHPRLKVMEAFMYRLHPQWRLAKRLVDDGAIGRLQTVHSHFSYFKLDPTNIRNQPEAGGGGLMDIGTYDVSLSRFLFGARARAGGGATVDVDPDLGVDRLVSAILDFGEGRTATFTCGTQMPGLPGGRTPSAATAASSSRSPSTPRRTAPAASGTRPLGHHETRVRPRRPVHAAGRGVLARRARRHPGADPALRRAGQHARDRRGVRERAAPAPGPTLAGGATSCTSTRRGGCTTTCASSTRACC
jgi:predicted dehydrogenase